MQEQLAGGFEVIRCSPVPPNTLFSFSIASLILRGGDTFAVAGAYPGFSGCQGAESIGRIEATTLEATFIASAAVTIDDTRINLDGGGPSDATNDPPRFENFELCASDTGNRVSCADIRSGLATGYVLVLFASPEG